MKKVLLLIPPSREMYSKSKVKVGVSELPSLTFATLAAPLLQLGHHVEVMDLDILDQPEKALQDRLSDLSPDIVGITCTTPLVGKVAEIVSLVKSHKPTTTVVAGGPHPSAFPAETLAACGLDIVCIGEGDTSLTQIASGDDLGSIEGICFRNDGRVLTKPRNNFITDLDALPLPAWSLFDLKRYKTPHISCRRNPVGGIETSRGCVFGCTYCNKTVFGRTFRPKSARRVVDEMEYMLQQGFGEIYVMDDGFTTDLKRAKEICKIIKQRGLKFPWNLRNGVRVDRVDRDFMEQAYDAGCYGITFGIETGDPEILKNINKGATLDQARQALKWAKEIGIQTLTFFMIGLPGETEDTMQRTIDFALELDADYAKTSILLPLPGTALFRDFDEAGYLKSKEWSLYNQHDPFQVYDHPNLDSKTISRYYHQFYRKYYLRPSFIWRQLKRDLFSKNLVYDVRDFLSIRW